MRYFNPLTLRSICNNEFNVWSLRASSRKFYLSCTDSKRGSCGFDNLLAQRHLSGSGVVSSAPSTSYHIPSDDDGLKKHLMGFYDDRLNKHLEAVLQEWSVATERYNTYLHEKYRWLRKKSKHWLLVSQIEELERIKAEVKKHDIILSELEKEDKRDLLMIVREARKVLESNMQLCKEKILQHVIPVKEVNARDVVMELSAGVGCKEATLFVKDLHQMYCNFADFKRWKYEILRYDTADRGGLRQAHIRISGDGAYRILNLESGVHTMQRVPETNRPSRMRTSTATVTVLLQPTDDSVIKRKGVQSWMKSCPHRDTCTALALASLCSKLGQMDLECLNQNSEKYTGRYIMIHPKDLKVELSCYGGQHVNRSKNVCITHVPTGSKTWESLMEPCEYRNEASYGRALKSLNGTLFLRMACKNRKSEQSKNMQIETAGRSEKVRTYNFSQNLITDHRLQESVDDVDGFLQGQEKLDHLTDKLQSWWSVQSLHDLLKKYA